MIFVGSNKKKKNKKINVSFSFFFCFADIKKKKKTKKKEKKTGTIKEKKYICARKFISKTKFFFFSLTRSNKFFDTNKTNPY